MENNYNQAPKMKRGKGSGWTTALIVGGVLVLSVLVWWWVLTRSYSSDSHNDDPDEYVMDGSYGMESGNEGSGVDTDNHNDASTVTSDGAAATYAMPDGAAEAEVATTLLPLDTPMSYTGTVNPGGVATLNITYFSNGRIMGTLDYSSGRHLEIIGHYTFRNPDRIVDLSLTTSNADDPAYSESWTGHSSTVKDDMAHTLIFKEIYTSKGGSMTASFALRP